ncbi:suppresses F exclusion of bacteriophage T7 [Salmonella enterica subsp. enterica serovar Heidelberg str. RI-11-014316]|nr:suppresses F exclusion of bacteriophage T7 [Salmonella enterica subsp. enterica serovar Heidelberg str. RI-11-014316]
MRWIPFLAVFLYVYIEISIFIQVAHVLGVLMTLILVIFTSVIGMSLVRNQGFKNFLSDATKNRRPVRARRQK